MNPHHKWYACRRCAGQQKGSEDRSPPAAVNVRYRQNQPGSHRSGGETPGQRRERTRFPHGQRELEMLEGIVSRSHLDFRPGDLPSFRDVKDDGDASLIRAQIGRIIQCSSHRFFTRRGIRRGRNPWCQTGVTLQANAGLLVRRLTLSAPGCEAGREEAAALAAADPAAAIPEADQLESLWDLLRSATGGDGWPASRRHSRHCLPRQGR